MGLREEARYSHWEEAVKIMEITLNWDLFFKSDDYPVTFINSYNKYCLTRYNEELNTLMNTVLLSWSLNYELQNMECARR